MDANLQVRFVRHPVGWVTEDCFRVAEAPLEPLGPGEFRVRNRVLSIDPYQRRQLNPATVYADKVRLGDVMTGRTIGEVVESRHGGYAVGEHVFGSLGWQRYATSAGHGVSKIDPAVQPLSVWLGPLGSPGVTAWVGMYDIARPRPGETVVVSAAGGAVGSVAGQLAKLAGCRVVGIAGGPDKCRFVEREFGLDACVDHRAPDFADQLAAATPGGIDVDFENAGGVVLDRVLARLNPFARIALCGLVSQYNEVEPAGVRNFGELLEKDVTVTGFRIGNYAHRRAAALGSLTALYRDGRLRHRETATVGLERAPAALIAMLRGANFGKQVVTIPGDD